MLVDVAKLAADVAALQLQVALLTARIEDMRRDERKEGTRRAILAGIDKRRR